VKLTRHRRDWDDLAGEDLYWSILSDPDRRFSEWDADAFLASGRQEIAGALQRAASFGLPRAHGRALDFGCGAGRLTRALAERFDEAVGVDISERMIEEARHINGPAATFVVNVTPDLRLFADASLDLVYSSNVLQHIADTAAIRSYLGEFVRVLRPGGLLTFQLPSHIPLRHRLQPRRRVYHALRALRLPRRWLFRTLRLQPIAMIALRELEVGAAIAQAGGRVLAVDSASVAGSVLSSTYYVTKEDAATASSTAAS
jgi:SAM-dependent methyltransferase